MNLKSLGLGFLLSLLYNVSFGQCAVEDWSLEKRVKLSDRVIEAEVIHQESKWNHNHTMIHTVHTLKVYKVLKGASSATVEAVTEGGTVGLERIQVDPSLQLEQGNIGIFLLSKNVDEGGRVDYRPTASTQSFIAYNTLLWQAHDGATLYRSIPHELYTEINQYTEGKVVEIEPLTTSWSGKLRALAPPTIDSFSTDTVASGAGVELTIYGSNYGASRGSGKVGFRDANYGDGRFYYSPVGWTYKTWNDSVITLVVPSRAGTGSIEVINGSGESSTSNDDLQIKWSVLNVVYPVGVDTPFFQIDHNDANGLGGYSWRMTHNFAGNTPARNTFIRALEEWRCETGINWDLDSNTSADSISGADGINVIRFTEFGDNKLGVCYSYYSGCFYGPGTNINWFVRELDIQFDSTYNWYFGTGSPGGSQFDFESVALHELGHGHQQGHVIAPAKVMHYSIGPGSRKEELVSADIECGNYVVNRGAVTNPCGPDAMIPLTFGQCAMSAPEGDFTSDLTMACPDEDIVFTDQTPGAVTSYVWDFGSGATPANANTKGPHTVQYSDSGTKTITLYTSNIIGTDTVSHTVYIEVDSLETPIRFVEDDSVCLGFQDYQINEIPSATSYAWVLSEGGSFNGGTTGRSVQVEWTEAGQHTITAIAANVCGVSEPQKDTVEVVPYTKASFTATADGLELTFTNRSDHAVSSLWDFGDGVTSTDTHPVHPYPDKGSYTVKLKTTNFCGSDSVQKEYTVNFRVSIENLEHQVVAYPNPVQSGTNLYISNGRYTAVELYSLEGKRIFSSELVNNTVTLPVVQEALYIVKLSNGEHHYYMRVHIVD